MSMPKILIIPGHRLLSPDRIGRGRAECECGQLSPESDTAGRRREWHRLHKEEIWKAMGE